MNINFNDSFMNNVKTAKNNLNDILINDNKKNTLVNDIFKAVFKEQSDIFESQSIVDSGTMNIMNDTSVYNAENTHNDFYNNISNTNQYNQYKTSSINNEPVRNYEQFQTFGKDDVYANSNIYKPHKNSNEYKPSFDKEKTASDLKALETDLKRIEAEIKDGNLKKDIKQIREKIKDVVKKLESGELKAEDVSALLSFMNECSDMLSELSLTKDSDFRRALKLVKNISEDMGEDLKAFELNSAKEFLKDIVNMLEKDGITFDKSKKHGLNEKEIVNTIKKFINQLSKSKDNKVSGKELNIEKMNLDDIKKALDKLKSMISEKSEKSVETAKIKDSIDNIEKTLENLTKNNELNIEIRDSRLYSKAKSKKLSLQEKNKVENTIKTKTGSEKSTNVQNSTELKTELYVKGNSEVNLNTESKSFIQNLAKSQQNATAGTEPKDIISQIVKKASVNIKENKSEMVIQLKPEALGKIKIKLSVSDGELAGKVIVESNEVKKIIQNNMNDLSQALKENGIELGSLNIELGQGFGDFELQNNDLEFGSMLNENEQDEINNQSPEGESKVEEKSALPDWLAGNVNISG